MCHIQTFIFNSNKMKKTKLLLLTICLSVQYSYSQVRIDTFELAVNAQEQIKGKHFYSEKTNGQLVLFSGTFNSDQRKYINISNKLASAGFHVITYDQRGHGISSARLTKSELPEGKLPIHSKETHDAIEKYHPIDLESVFQYALGLTNVDKSKVIISLESGIQAWSFKMIKKHPEIKNFILLTSYFGEEGEKHFSQYTGFNILSILTGSHPEYASKTKAFFEQNKNHSIQEIECIEGWGFSVVEKCPSLEEQIIGWIKRT